MEAPMTCTISGRTCHLPAGHTGGHDYGKDGGVA